MRLIFYLRVEINRIFKSRVTWLFILLTMASPLFGLTIFKINNVQTSATQMIINPVLTGTIGASVLFALFTLFELDKVNKYRTSALTDAVAPAVPLHIARIGAVFAVSAVTGILTILAYYPYTMSVMQSFFDLALYIQSYLLFMIPGMWIGSLFAAIFYQVFRRVDISFLLFAACVLLSFAGFIGDDFILRWINPTLPVFSDGFGNIRPLRMGLYNRLFWIMFLGGSWLISLLFTRKYGKGIIGSTLRNLKKFYLPAAGAVLIILSVRHYNNQPFFNNAPPEVDWDAVYDTGADVNCSSVTAEIKPDLVKGTMRGKITYVINGVSEPVIKRLIINSGYKVYSITANGKTLEYTDMADDNFVTKHIEFEIPAGEDIELVIDYGGYPMNWSAYKETIGSWDINPKNVDLSNWSLIPSLNIYNADVSVSVILPDNLVLLAWAGEITGINANNDGTKTWLLKDSRDFINIYASDYACKIVEADKMKSEFYFHSNFAGVLEKNNADEVFIDVFNYCTEHFGPLNYLDNNMLRLIQISAFIFGGYASSGTSSMGETFFSIYSITDTDSEKGATGKEILAHEIIHQWWGLNVMVTEDLNYPEWTSEGLTVYSTYRLYKEKYGEEYAQKNYVDKWGTAVEEMNRNFYRRHPEYLAIMPEDFAARIRISELDAVKYSLMPLKIYKAAELVGGEDAMDKILTRLSWSNPYGLTYRGFLKACGLTKGELEID